MTKPVWRKWLQIPTMTLWEACLLSLNIEPTKIKSHRVVWMGDVSNGPAIAKESFPSVDIREEYEIRLAVLSANFTNSQYFSPATINMTGAAFCKVSLPEFAHWAKAVVKWQDLPTELVELVSVELTNNSETTHENITLRDDDGGNPKKVTSLVDSTHWKLRVQEAANRFWMRAYSQGGSPTISNMKDLIARWCREHDVKTSSGIYPSAEYLRTHVLGAKHWTPPKK